MSIPLCFNRVELILQLLELFLFLGDRVLKLRRVGILDPLVGVDGFEVGVVVDV